MSKRALIKSASIISSATLFSRVLGFVRMMLMASTFGTGWLAQAFFVAFRIPNMLRDLAGEGASNAAFVPVFSEYLATKSRQEFWRLIRRVFLALLTVVTFITVVGIVFSPFIVKAFTPGFIEDAAKFALTVQMNRVLFVYFIFIAVAAFLTGVLYAFQSFFASSFAPGIFNVVLIAAILCADNSIQGIGKLVAGVLIAGVLQVIIQLPALSRCGFRFRPKEETERLSVAAVVADPGVRKIGRLLVPRIMGTAIYHINIFVDTIFASFAFLVGQDAIAAIFYAGLMIQFPLGIFGHAISSATLPELSHLAAKKEMDKYVETVTFSLTNILFVMLPAELGLIVLAHPIITLLFERGQFSAYSSAITATALAFYAVGLAAYALNKFFALCFNSLHDTVTPTKIAGGALLLNIILNVLFVVVLRTKIAGLALASALSAIIASCAGYVLLQRRIRRIDSRLLFAQLCKMLCASSVMAIMISFAWQRAEHLAPAPLVLGAVACIGIGVYVLLCHILGVHQVRSLLQWLLKR